MSEPDVIRNAIKELAAMWRSLDASQQATALDGFVVPFAYNSGKIENPEVTLHDTEEIFDHGRVVSFTGELRTLFEISNQKDAWEWALKRATNPAPLTEVDVLEAHRLLTRGTYDETRWAKGERPGSYKRGFYVVGDNVGADPDEVPALMGELLDETADALTPGLSLWNALIAAAYLHGMLVEIHPFADGNGRTARLLMNLVLLQQGWPPVVIADVDRMAYFGALDAFHAGQPQPFFEFCRVELLQTWRGRL